MAMLVAASNLAKMEAYPSEVLIHFIKEMNIYAINRPTKGHMFLMFELEMSVAWMCCDSILVVTVALRLGPACQLHVVLAERAAVQRH